MIRALVASAPNSSRATLAGALEDAGILADQRACPAGHLSQVVLGRPYDALLVSIELPGLDRSTWRELVGVADPAPVLAILDSPTDSAFVDALWAGARGAILRSHPERGPAAVRAAIAGDVAIPRETTTFLVATVVRQQQLILGVGPVAGLTGRERQVYRLMQEGRSTSEIARELAVAPVTVRSHVSAILRKLQVGDRREAVDLAGQGN